MNSTHRKRLFTILLSLLLTISMLPAGVFADITDGDEDQNQVVTEQADQSEDPAPEEQAGSNEGLDSSGAGEAANPKNDPPANEGKSGEQADTEKSILYFITHGLGQLTVVDEDGHSIDASNPASPGDKVKLSFTISELQGGKQFDMDDMYLDIPAGLVVPDEDVVYSRISKVSVKDEYGEYFDLHNTIIVGSDGKIKYIWENPCVEVRDGVEVDVYALAKRAEDFNFSFTLEMIVGKNADSITFTDELSFPVDRSVALTVTKDISFSPSGINELTTAQAQAMVFGLFEADGTTPVKDENGNDITFTYADMGRGSAGNNKLHGEKKLTGLISTKIDSEGNRVYPAVFVVKETGHPNISGYSFISTGDQTEKTVSIEAGSSGTAALQNDYTKDIGYLKLKKSFPSESVLNYGSLSTNQKKTITFTITNSDGTYSKTITLYDFGANDYYDLQVPPGTYTVVETADLTGFSRTTTYYVDSTQGSTTTSGPSSAEVSISDKEHHEVEFANTYTEEQGKLKLKKTFDGAELTNDQKKNVTFTVKDADGNKVKELKYSEFVNGEYTIDPIRVGTYTVTESNTGLTNYTVTSTYAVNGSDPVSGTTASNVGVTLGGTSEVDFANTYTEVGKVTVVKEIGGDYWASNATWANKRNKIQSGVTYKLYKEGDMTTPIRTTKLSSFTNTNTHAYTWSNIPVGNYVVVEEISGNGNIANTIRTSSVTVTGGSSSTAAPDATPVTSGTLSVSKGGTATATYTNNYNKKKGKIKLDKKVIKDGEEVDPSTLKEDEQKQIKFTITGKDVYDNNVSKTVSLYDILRHQNGVDANGYIELPYCTNYTVKETGADLTGYVRVTSAKLDDGDYSAGANVSSIAINDTTPTHSVTYKNEYSGRGRLKIDKTVSGLSASEEAEVRANIYFTIVDSASGRPIVKENGKYVLGQAGATPAHIPLSELESTNGIDIPTGTYIITEYGWKYHEDYYTCSTSNILKVGDDTIYEVNSPVSGNTEILLNNTKLVNYTNTYTRTGVGSGVTVRKRVYLDGTDTEGNIDEEAQRLRNLVLGQIRFKVYRGNKVDATQLFGEYTYAQLLAAPLNLYAGTWTIQETKYDVEHYTHIMKFTVGTTVSTNDHVTFTLTQNSPISISVINYYTPLGNLEVQKFFGANSDLKASDLTVAQKKAIKFYVTGYKDDTKQEVVFPTQEFSYYDMTQNSGVMSKRFKDIPTGFYVVTESANITNYNVNTVLDPDGNGVSVPYNSLAIQKFTNTYTRQKGYLEVQKSFNAPDTLTDAQRKAIHFKVTQGNTVIAEFDYSQMDENGKKVIGPLETGNYTVKETNADFDFFERTTTVSVNGGTDTKYSEANGVNASVENDATATVHITNEYKETGALIINKSFIDGECMNKLTDDQKEAVKFTVKRVKEDGSTETIETIYYSDIDRWIKAHPTQSPQGYRLLVLPGNYIVEESDANFTGYTRETTATVNGASATVTNNEGGTVSTVTVPTIVKFTEADVAFTNKYTEVGSLKIKKKIEGYSNLTQKEKEAIHFTVKQGETVIEEFSFADMDAKGEYTIPNLPAGLYTVEETVTIGDDTFYGQNCITYVTVGAGEEYQKNTVDVTVNKSGQTVTYRNVFSNSDRLSVVKQIGGAPYVYIEKDGSSYPVWKFNLRIDNLQPSTVNNGSTNLIDVYDDDKKGLFKIVTSTSDLEAIDAAIDAQGGEAENAKTKANKLVLPPGVTGTPATVTLVENYDDDVTFKITGVTGSTAKKNDLTYYLIPKNAAALEALNSNNDDNVATASNQLLKEFSNTVTYKPLSGLSDETTSVDYEYRKTVVLKNVLNLEDGHLTDGHGHNVDYALYDFIINPEEMKLSTEGYIDVVDEFSNTQSVDPESITVKRCNYNLADGTYTTSDLQTDDVTLKDMQGNKIMLRVRDETCFRVTYRAYLLYTDGSQIVKLNNKVTVAGYSKEIKPEALPASQGSGSVYSIRLRKYQDGNLDNGLKGAEFKMYTSLAAAQADYDAHAADPSVGYPNAVGTYETDKDGVVHITEYTSGGYTHQITADAAHPITYCFIESKAPTGYELIDYIVQVRLAGNGETAHYGPDYWVYLPSDTVLIREYPHKKTVKLGALKTLTTNGGNISLGEGDFSFTIRAKNNANIPMPEGTVNGEKTVSNGADGKAVFGTITYNTEDIVTRNSDGDITDFDKQFVYEVFEVLPEDLDANGNKNGVHYDSNVYEVKVTVHVLDGVTSVKVGNKAISPDNNVYFAGLENVYDAKGEAKLKIKKELGEGDTWPEGKNAVFTLTAVTEGAPMPKAAGGNTVTLTSAAEGSFGKIEYPLTSAGQTYEYTITETTGFGSGWTNAAPITATVVVSEDTGTGQLGTTVTYDPENFTAINDYDANGEATLKVKKKVTAASGKTITWPWPEGKSAVFTLTANTTGAPMPAAGGETVTLTSAAEGSFGKIEYPLTSAGQTYEYTITETTGFGDGWTNAAPITATVVVGDDTGSGQLETTVTYDPQDLTATNDYDAEGSIPVKGTKKFKNGSFDDETFTFSVYTEDDFNAVVNPPLARTRDRNDPAVIAALQEKVVMTASTSGLTADADGKVSFDFKTADDKDLEYKLEDILDGNKVNGHLTKTFKYVVVEDIPEEAVKKTVNGETFYYLYDKATGRDVKYDATVHTMTITVTDNGDGTLDVTSNPGGKQPSFGFVNEKIYTKIRLTKLLDQVVDGDTESELTNVTCVFKVTYTDPILGRKVNRTVSVQFNASSASSDIAELDKIPIEATDLKVEEVYSADYEGNIKYGVAKLEVDPDTNLPLNPPFWTVTFENRRKGDITGGGVINSVENNGNGFVITNRRDSTGNNPPPQQPADDFR